MLTIAVVTIQRFNPETDAAPSRVDYQVEVLLENTLLEILQQVAEVHDSSLAFRYGCRFKHCGLCAVTVNGYPKMACLTKFKDGMLVEPLAKLPLIRDLVVDRRFLTDLLAQHQVFLLGQPSDGFANIRLSEGWEKLSRCKDCLACLSLCPRYEYTDAAFGGPYLFVKLAQFHLDPRDRGDRKEQARGLGIERCRDCRRCYCPNGVPIYSAAIQPLLD